MEIQEVLERAKSNSGFKSERKLAQSIGVTHPTLLRIRRGWGYPSEENMVKLGELAGISRAEALLLLNFWKSQGEARTVYSDLLRRLAASALCFVMLMVSALVSPAIAGNSMLRQCGDTVYYG